MINRFDLHGISLLSDGNTVETCFIGTNAAGTASAGNGGSGIMMSTDSANNTIGGAGNAMNLVSGNRGHGIAMKGAGVTNNLVAGNFVGTNLAGDIALPNAVNGININQGANGNTVGENDVAIVTFVAGNNGQGINIAGAGTSGNTVIQTTVGSNLGSGIRITGGATNNRIGGSVDGEFNVISSNLGNGVLIQGNGTSGNTVLGNLIGVDQDGLVDLGNGGNGVTINQGASGNTIGGTAPFEGNVISGNAKNGVNINGSGTSGNTVAGNIIGADATGTVDLGNTLSGIQIAGGATGNAIGGTDRRRTQPDFGQHQARDCPDGYRDHRQHGHRQLDRHEPRRYVGPRQWAGWGQHRLGCEGQYNRRRRGWRGQHDFRQRPRGDRGASRSDRDPGEQYRHGPGRNDRTRQQLARHCRDQQGRQHADRWRRSG